MPIDLDELKLRMADSRAESVGIYANGLVRVFHRWGTVDFPNHAALQEWIVDGKLPRGCRTKFSKFNPQNPN